jgi:hypothetical protein
MDDLLRKSFTFPPFFGRFVLFLFLISAKETRMRASRLTLFRSPLLRYGSVFTVPFAVIGLAAIALEACSDDDTTGVTGTPEAGAGSEASTSRVDGSDPQQQDDSGASNDGGTKQDGSNNGTCGPNNASKTGETCIGFGAKPESCDAGCNPYGYVCFGGGPPAFANCHEMRVSAIVGNTYCCSENKCVAEPDQDQQCLDAGAGKTHRYQCPPNENGSGNVTPPNGCVEHVSGTTAVEKFFCCP